MVIMRGSRHGESRKTPGRTALDGILGGADPPRDGGGHPCPPCADGYSVVASTGGVSKAGAALLVLVAALILFLLTRLVALRAM